MLKMKNPRDHTTLAEDKEALLALLLAEEGRDFALADTITPREKAGDALLSFAQQRLWFLYQLDPTSPAYNILNAVRLTGQLNVAALQQSLSEIVRRHEALRTVFPTIEGRPVAVTVPVSPVRLPVVNLRDLSPPERDLQAEQWRTREVQRPFDLAHGPLVRGLLLWLGAQEYVLLLTMHHIVSDAWSRSVLTREVAALYAACAAGAPSPLPELAIQYADFAHWQRQWLQGAVLETQLAYWKQQLGDGLPVLELPTDRPRPVLQTSQGTRQAFVVPQTLTAALRTLGQQEGATVFMTLLAAFQTLLHRYTGQDDIAVGTPIANRTRLETEGLIGFFVNTLVLRTNMAGNPSFRELLRRVREVTLAAHTYQEVPFELLVDELRPARDPSHTPLFQVLFVLQHAAQETVALPGLTLSPLRADSGTAKFDLTLTIIEAADGLTGSLEYRTDLFDATTITRLLGHFTTLLEGISINPDQRLADVPLLQEAERYQLLVAWNDTTAAYPHHDCLQQWVEAQVRRTPDAIAVVYEDAPLTYGELNCRANQLAHHLRALGVGPEVRVGIALERSLEMVVGLLGILKAGGAYVPLDPDYPGERLAFMLADAQVPVLLTQDRLKSQWPEHGAQVICLDSGWTAIAKEHTTNPALQTTTAHVAYVMYTSGSTGKPKGVMIPQGGICNRLLWMQETYQLTAADRVLQKTPCSFDVSVWEFFWPLMTGARLVVARPGGHRDSAYLVDLIASQQITTLHFVPSMLSVFLEEPGLAACRCLRQVMCSGEALPVELQERFFARLAAALHNLYGPTEASVDVTFWACQRQHTAQTVPIGRPIANTHLYVLDPHLRPVPIGVPGELHIGGVGLARGYLNRPEQTAETFIPDPFSPMPGARLYKTGDLARYLPDGTLVFLGRNDQQVKIRGFRIELGEIEAVLGRHPAVREAVVVAREDGPGDKRLVAYVVSHPGQAPMISELRRFLQAQVPDYMVPAAFVLLETLPLTPNGKVDRRALPAPDHARPALERDFVAPRTPVEELIAGIWAQVLGLEYVGIHDNFFELGGHSLLATQVMSRVQSTFQVELPLRCLFEAPTVAGLSEGIERARRGEPGRQAPSLQPIARDGALALSFAQQRLWFLKQLMPGTPAYNILAAVRLTGRLNAAGLVQSLSEVVRRHEALRTTFTTVEGRPVQVISPAQPLHVCSIELSSLAAGQREAQAQRLATAEMQRPFDLTHGPLLRATVLRLSETEHVLLLTMHHIITDGWSMDVFMHEVAALYTAFVAGAPSPLPELALQYADFAQWQRQWLQGAVLEPQLAYWTQQLGHGLPLLALPTDHPRPALQRFQGARQTWAIAPPLTTALRTLSQQEGVTLFMTLLAAFQTLLHRYTGQTDIPIGTPVANRTRLETEALIGCFVNTLVVRTDLAGNPSFRALLRRVREVTVAAHTYQEVPFELLVDVLRPARDPSHTPLFQVMFVFQHAPRDPVALPGLTLHPLWVDSGTAKFDLTLTISESADGLTGVLEYRTDLFEAATIRRLLDHFVTLLEGIRANPDQRLTELPLLTAAERHQLLVAWNATPGAYPQEACITQLFEAQVARTPDAIALVYDDQQLTYRELNRRANQLAHHLQGLGVSPEVRVGLSVERSLAMVVGMLGIWKAGGAYVPLDPASPSQRLTYMLADAGMEVLVTQRRVQAQLPEPGGVLCVDLEDDMLDVEPTTAPSVMLSPEHLAYVIYTSGSTGAPKGVAVPHGALSMHCQAMGTLYGMMPEDRALHFASLSFDAAVEQWVVPLIHGACLVLRGPEIWSAEQVGTTLTAHGITRLDVPPAYAAELATWLRTRGTAVALRTCTVGGEAVARESVALLQHACQPATILNAYGPTEAVITPLVWVAADPEGATAYAPIGKAVGERTTYILDAALQVVPVGVVGELYIGGTGLARGYHGQPGLTAERFVPDPFSAVPGGRLYRTGDLARWQADGTVEYVGRVDDQVKLRGFRIELGEIEAVLRAHPGVTDAVVVAREEGNGALQPGDVSHEKHLVAYLVTDQPALPPQRELRSFLHTKLPDYMVPALFVRLDALPLTLNGKVDRRALPVPERWRPEPEAVYAAPRTEVQRTIATVWQEVLQVEKVGIHDNFFDLGGHSLLMAKVWNTLHHMFHQPLSLVDLFQYPTIHALATHLSQENPARLAPRHPDDLDERLQAGKSRLRQQLRQRQAADN